MCQLKGRIRGAVIEANERPSGLWEWKVGVYARTLKGYE